MDPSNQPRGKPPSIRDPASESRPAGQGADLLKTHGWDDRAGPFIEASYSSSSSFLRRRADALELGEAQAAPALGGAMSAPNMSFSTGFSPKPWGMVFSLRRSSTNSRSSRSVVRMKRRWVTGNCRWATTLETGRARSAGGRRSRRGRHRQLAHDCPRRCHEHK